MKFLLLLLVVGGAWATVDPTTLIDHCDDKSTFSRAQAMACLLDAVDLNHDGRIVPDEIKALPDTYLYWYVTSSVLCSKMC
jgi:hypothetical protein